MDYGKAVIEEYKSALTSSTGMHIVKDDNAFVAIFDGRKEYLSERGPIVCAVWLKKYGILSKGAFGPWLGAFGNKYSNETVLRNYCGLLIKKSFINLAPNSFLGKICHTLGISFRSRFDYAFVPVSAEFNNGGITLTFYCNHKETAVFNLPLLKSSFGSPEIKLQVEGVSAEMKAVCEMSNQYGRVVLYQSAPVMGRVWSITIK